VTDDDVAPTLGRRLDALARARMRTFLPRPAWAAPLVVALRRSEEIAGVLGERFERTETAPRGRAAEPPAGLADLVGRSGAHATGPEHDGERHGPDEELQEVPADVRYRLRQEVGPAADAMRVHAGPRADAVARAADADAVTVGPDVHLRQGRWAPRREEGVALLAHEATHVAGVLDPGTAWLRAVGADAEEALARARERSVLGLSQPDLSELGWSEIRHTPERAPAAPSPVPAPAPPPPPGAPLPGATISAPAARTAGVERDLTSAAPAPDPAALRRDLLAEVMQRVRSEIERGA